MQLARWFALVVSIVLSVRGANAQAPLQYQTVAFDQDTGLVSNTSDQTQTVISLPVVVSGAQWLRLYFDTIELGDAVLRVTSYKDGDVQELHASHCVEWQNSTCYFNGNAVQVEVEAPPHSGPYRLALERADAGDSHVAPESQCGSTDDRMLSNDQRVGRVMPVGCTAWIISDRNRGLLSADHCWACSTPSVVQFNVPNSLSNGALVMPAVSNQYAIDFASVQRSASSTCGAGVLGDDWAYFGVFANAGISAGLAQGWSFDLGAAPPGPGHEVQISGYGVDTTPQSFNQVQQAHIGSLVGATTTTMQHQADTEAGGSGSPIIWTRTGEAIGIHTNPGCVATMPSGWNSGTAISHPALQNALAHPLGVCREPKLLASDGAAGDQFGYSVSVSGDTIVVGAYLDEDNGTDSGSAYVYVRTGTTWIQQAKLVASDGVDGDEFGTSVSVSGDTAIVGATYSDGAVSNAGAACVFVRNGSNWTQKAKLWATDGVIGSGFGSSVSISGDSALVGAYRALHGSIYPGAAYEFVRNGATWIQRAKLVASDGAQSDYFGIEVCLNADTAVVGAFLDDDNGTDSGSAYLFVRAGTTWVQQAKLLASDGAAGDYFGRAVSVSGETALLGAWGDDDNGSYSGSAYVFARVGPFWTQQAKLRASDGSAFDYFGRGLSLSADAAVVGALGDDDNGVTSGSAYIFMRKGVNWTQVQKFLPSDGDSVDSLGRSVCTSGDVVVIGAELDEQTAIDAGSAYEFHITNTYASTYCNYATSKTNSIGCLPALRFSGTPSVTVASPFSLIATSLVNNQHARLLYSTVGRANTSVRIGTYCIAPPYRSSTLLPTGGTVVVPDCSGTAAFDFNAWLRNGNDAAIVAGTTVYTQFRFDDPGDPARKGLTNAVEFTVLP